MTVAAQTGAPDAPPTGRRELRKDIQGLRALAVLLVVANHLFEAQLTGGYVGVDVFFVISGFLIGSHLIREVASTGRIKLGAFYARRIRRLLPAAFLVLAGSAVALLTVAPYSVWSSNASEILASAFYGENWLLAAKSVNYSASTEAASVAQHYWSLSVEEQFYLFWPLLILALCWLGTRRSRDMSTFGRRGVTWGIAVISVLSFVCSVVTTQHLTNQAYFLTPNRVFEFGLGTVVALVASRISLPNVLRQFLALAGFAAVFVAAFTFGPKTPFPGWLAIVPALGTALVIAAGTGADRMWHAPITSLPPIQYIGNISYSLYLWHWPLIVIVPLAAERSLDVNGKLAVLAASLVLAALSKKFIEDTAQFHRLWARVPWRGFAGMGIGLACVGALAATLFWQESALEQQALARESSMIKTPCYGPSALSPQLHCANPHQPVADPVMGKKNQYWNTGKQCHVTAPEVVLTKSSVFTCDFSRGKPDADVVWLVGDSHAQQWQPAILRLAQQRGWKVRVGLLGGCEVADAKFVGYEGSTNPASATHCIDWSRLISDRIARARPARVFYTTFAREQRLDDGTGRPQPEQQADALSRTWKRWADAGTQVDVLGDPPLNSAVRNVNCVVWHKDDPLACAIDRSKAQPPDPLIVAAARTADRRVRLIDTTPYFCDQRRCFGAVGGVAVYYDPNHLNFEYSSLLAPMIGAQLDR